MEITVERFNKLTTDEMMLRALKSWDVQSWENYDDALAECRDKLDIKKKRHELFDALQDAFEECSYEPSGRGEGIEFGADLEEKVMTVLELHHVFTARTVGQVEREEQEEST